MKFKTALNSALHFAIGLWWCLYMAIVFVFSNTGQLLVLLVRPFSKHMYTHVNAMIVHWTGVSWLIGARLSGIRFVMSGDDIPPDENVIIVSNHQGMTDMVALCAIAKGKGRIGWFRCFVKDSLKYYPGLGLALWASGAIFVKRDWSKDRESIHKVFRRIISEQLPVLLMIFPEGTRATPKKLASSRLGAKRGYKNILPPRPRGFIASVEGLRSHVVAVYDVTIGYPEGTPSLFAFFSRRATHIHIDLRRFPIDSLPQGSGELAEWLDARFINKDLRLEKFKQTLVFDNANSFENTTRD